jgi:hypothetical protein
MKLNLFAALVQLSAVFAQRQIGGRSTICGNEAPRAQPSKALLEKYNQIARVNGSLAKEADAIATAPLLPIRTFFHVVANTIEQARTVNSTIIGTQIQVLNANFLTSGFLFTLAGTTYTNDSNWADGGGQGTNNNTDEVAMKTALRSPSYRELNIYILSNLFNPSGSGTQGVCTYPTYLNSNLTQNAAFDRVFDGCMIDFSVLPSPASIPSNREGKTAVHEVGHWLGLIHVWGDITGCIGTDDVDDTPIQYGASSAGPQGQCPPLTQDTCPQFPGYDNVDNFMGKFSMHDFELHHYQYSH